MVVILSQDLLKETLDAFDSGYVLGVAVAVAHSKERG